MQVVPYFTRSLGYGEGWITVRSRESGILTTSIATTDHEVRQPASVHKAYKYSVPIRNVPLSRSSSALSPLLGTGDIPEELGHLTALTALWLEHNRLTGELFEQILARMLSHGQEVA